MAKSSAEKAPARAYYSEATERTFRAALEKLEASLPEHHAALAELLDAGKLDDIDAIVAVLEGQPR